MVKGVEMDLEKLQTITAEKVGANIDAHVARMQAKQEREEAVKALEASMTARDEAYIALSAIAIDHAGVVDYESESFVVGTQDVPVGAGEGVTTRNLRAIVRNDFGRTGEAVEVNEQFPRTVTVTFALEAKEGDLEEGIFSKTEPIGKKANGHTIFGQQVAYERFEATKVPNPTATGTQSSEVLLYGANTQDTASAIRQREAVEAQIPVITGTLELIQGAIEVARQQ